MNNSPRDTWMPMRMFPPQTCEVLEVLLDDGTVAKALWTGSKWWRGRTAVDPRGWRFLPDDVAQVA